jgi:hypothetical protein
MWMATLPQVLDSVHAVLCLAHGVLQQQPCQQGKLEHQPQGSDLLGLEPNQQFLLGGGVSSKKRTSSNY